MPSVWIPLHGRDHTVRHEVYRQSLHCACVRVRFDTFSDHRATFCDVILRYLFSAPIFGARNVLNGNGRCYLAFFPFSWRIGGHIVLTSCPTMKIAL